jgi:hypothetical protein
MSSAQVKWLFQVGLAAMSVVSLLEHGKRRGWL